MQLVPRVDLAPQPPGRSRDDQSDKRVKLHAILADRIASSGISSSDASREDKICRILTNATHYTLPLTRNSF